MDGWMDGWMDGRMTDWWMAEDKQAWLSMPQSALSTHTSNCRVSRCNVTTLSISD